MPVGHVVGGRYRVASLLGSGGMGVLYVAEHLFTHRRVALKVLHPERGDDLEHLKARFLSEARTAAAVRHPHVVDVLDMGTDEDGMPFLVMELLEGCSLDQLLKAEGRLSPAQALGWIMPVIGALAVLHDAGIVHRDVKPSNLFLCHTPGGRLLPKLLDFGLARVVSDLRLTRSGVVIGTPLYMAPEHASGREVGSQADVWSLGVVLYECLTGESPYRASDGAALATQVLAGHVRPLHLVRPDLPVPFANAVERALRRDLSLRYRDMREFARGLLAGALASGIEVPIDPDPVGLPGFNQWLPDFEPRAAVTSAPASISPSHRIEIEPSSTPVALSSGPHTTRRGLWTAPLFVVLLVLLVAIGGVSYALLARTEVRRPPPALVSSPAAVPPNPGPEPRPTVAPLPREVQTLEPPAAETGAVKPERKLDESTLRRRRRTAPRPAQANDGEVDIATEWK